MLEIPQAGDWFTSGGGFVSSFDPSEGFERLMPLWLDDDMTINALGINVVAAGTTGAVIRLGVRGADPFSGRPSGLLLDAGTVDGTVVANPTITGLSIPAGRGLIYVSVTVQGAATTRPTIPGMNNHPWPMVKGDIVSTASVCWFATGVTGALPATFGGTRQSSTLPRPWVRRA